MAHAKDVAAFFLKLDKDGNLFNDAELTHMNGRTFYTGNARLNKYLHLAQNIYYAKTSNPLFEESIYAYDNGGVIPEIRENYRMLLSRKNKLSYLLSDDEQAFLTKLYMVLENAPIEKLIELSHEDPEWIAKHSFYNKQDQKMDTLSHLDDYREQYADIIYLMDRM